MKKSDINYSFFKEEKAKRTQFFCLTGFGKNDNIDITLRLFVLICIIRGYSYEEAHNNIADDPVDCSDDIADDCLMRQSGDGKRDRK